MQCMGWVCVRVTLPSPLPADVVEDTVSLTVGLPVAPSLPDAAVTPSTVTVSAADFLSSISVAMVRDGRPSGDERVGVPVPTAAAVPTTNVNGCRDVEMRNRPSASRLPHGCGHGHCGAALCRNHYSYHVMTFPQRRRARRVCQWGQPPLAQSQQLPEGERVKNTTVFKHLSPPAALAVGRWRGKTVARARHA